MFIVHFLVSALAVLLIFSSSSSSCNSRGIFSMLSGKKSSTVKDESSSSFLAPFAFIITAQSRASTYCWYLVSSSIFSRSMRNRNSASAGVTVQASAGTILQNLYRLVCTRSKNSSKGRLRSSMSSSLSSRFPLRSHQCPPFPVQEERRWADQGKFF